MGGLDEALPTGGGAPLVGTSHFWQHTARIPVRVFVDGLLASARVVDVVWTTANNTAYAGMKGWDGEAEGIPPLTMV